jgi:hypothetical protein
VKKHKLVSKILQRQFLIVGCMDTATTMGGAQSRVRGIQRLHTAGLSYKTIATDLKCSYPIIAVALHSTDSESPPMKRGRKKIITPEISRCIERLSLMDLLLADD